MMLGQLAQLYPLRLERHKDAVAAVQLSADMISFVMIYRVPDGLAVSALFSVLADVDNPPLRELPDYHELVHGYAMHDGGYKVEVGGIVQEQYVARMSPDAIQRLQNNIVTQRLLKLAEFDRFLAIAINSPDFAASALLPFQFQTTEVELAQLRRLRAEARKKKTGQRLVDVPEPGILRTVAWFEEQRALFQRLLNENAFAAQHNALYRNRVLDYCLENYYANNGLREDAAHAFFAALDLAEQVGLTQKPREQREEEATRKLLNQRTGALA
jgi:hypothetical protein